MSKPTWTLDDLEAEVRKLADQRADHVYENPDRESSFTGCMYIHDHTDNEPGCIFGVALHNLGVPKDVLARCNRVGTIWGILHHEFGFDTEELSTPQADWMIDVQRFQDCGIAWGPAVHRADQKNER